MLFSDFEKWIKMETDTSSKYQNEEGILEAWSWIDSVDAWIEDINDTDNKYSFV